MSAISHGAQGLMNLHMHCLQVKPAKKYGGKGKLLFFARKFLIYF
jgi:hypothetical protein